MVLAGGFAKDHGMNRRIRPLTCVFTFAKLAALSNDAVALARHKKKQRLKPRDDGE
jgi:hypothetical protein